MQRHIRFRPFAALFLTAAGVFLLGNTVFAQFDFNEIDLPDLNAGFSVAALDDDEDLFGGDLEDGFGDGLGGGGFGGGGLDDDFPFAGDDIDDEIDFPEADALGGDGLLVDEVLIDDEEEPAPVPVKNNIAPARRPAADPAERITEVVVPVLPPPVAPGAGTVPPVKNSIVEPNFPVLPPPAADRLPAQATQLPPQNQQWAAQPQQQIAAQPQQQTMVAGPAGTVICRNCQLANGTWRARVANRLQQDRAAVAQPQPYYGDPRGFSAPAPAINFGARHQPMVDPYYTFRGPRDFNDPNPRPIGP